jgi:hypothetical protein
MSKYDYTASQFYKLNKWEQLFNNYRQDPYFTPKQPTDLCEAYVLNLFPLWDEARLSYGDRPDWDVELTENGVKTTYEVKTQKKQKDDRNTNIIHSYIEIGEVGTKRNQMNPDDLFHWVKTGLYASVADKYIIYKRIDESVQTLQNKNWIYNVYEIDGLFFKTEIENYFFELFKARITDYGNNGFELVDAWWGRKNTSPLEKVIKEIDDALNDRANFKILKHISRSGNIIGLGISKEKGYGNSKRNINVVFDLQKLVDNGDATVTNNVNVESIIEPDNNNDLSQYFNRFDVERLQGRTIDDLKADPNFTFDKDAKKEMKIDLLFDKNTLNKWPFFTNKILLSYDFYNYLTYFFMDDLNTKEIGLEKVGLGYDSDSSSDSSDSGSSSDSDTGLQFLNLISKK